MPGRLAGCQPIRLVNPRRVIRFSDSPRSRTRVNIESVLYNTYTSGYCQRFILDNYWTLSEHAIVKTSGTLPIRRNRLAGPARC